MEFGIQFFPDVGPQQRSAQDYWRDSLHLTGLCDELGYTTVRTVEHYFHPYGGYSPDPILFLTAASQRSRGSARSGSAGLSALNLRSADTGVAQSLLRTCSVARGGAAEEAAKRRSGGSRMHPARPGSRDF